MKHFNATRPGRAVALAAFAMAGAAGAAGPAQAQVTDTPVVAVVVAAPAAPAAAPAKPSPFGAGAAVDATRLTDSRGGASTTTLVDIGGVVKDAMATNVATGNNAIRDGSFANAVGFNTVIQNSGANVLIQNSMTVNVQFK